MIPSNAPIHFNNCVENVPVDEAHDIQQIAEAVGKILARSKAATGRFQGDVHVKTIGFAEGEFRVLPNLPAELAQGLFARNHTYPAVVRFSNSASQVQSDAIPDGRGMAIKIRELDGEWIEGTESLERSQDFLMINHPVFFATTVKEYLRLQQVLAHEEVNPLVKFGGFLSGGDWNPMHWHWKEVLTAARIVGKVPTQAASTTYFSMTPFRYGEFVAKYRVRPVGDRHESFTELVKSLGTEADAFRIALEATLRTQELLFEFQVQLWNDADKMPVEDPTVEWKESESPFRTVAHLLLPRQEIEPLRLKEEYRNLAFNVWHSLVAHRPLGGINRVRRAVYAISSSWRTSGKN